jgi:tetratricopeptide (TPR) repeat protein
LKLQPKRADLHIRFGTELQDMEQHEEAADHFRAAAELLPDQVAPCTALARSLSALGRREEAAAIFEAVAAAHPENPDAQFEMGKAFQHWGHFDDARRCFENALALQPGSPAVWYARVTGERFGSDHPAVAALERMATEAARYAEADRVQLHFALAKVYDDLRRPEEAFAQWQAGHAIQRRLTPYDEADELGLLSRIGEMFSADFLSAQTGAGDPSEVPVFIVGMPRSGTTLVEQMLASHPDVFGAGEAADLARLYDSLNAGDRALTRDELAWVGARYVERLRRRAPTAKRITNKMPGNFAAVGLIAAALPHARIIHVRRDPVDTCFSFWSNLFNTGHLYTHDLGELGRYYRGYEKLMAHWRRALPEGALIEVAYEDLVGNFETQARRLVAACGLAWDPACLAFHKTERPVETAAPFRCASRSTAPRSAGRRLTPHSWRRYAKRLRPEDLPIDESQPRGGGCRSFIG